MVDQLASDYDSQPVVFLEQYALKPIGDRIDYFWEAHGWSPPPSLPMVIVDSGHQFRDGPVNYYNVYKQMVDDELARPPLADVQATYTRVGNHLHFEVSVKNLSGVTLSFANDAKVHVIVYENTKVSLTSRYVRAEVDMNIPTPLADGATGHYSLDTEDLSGVDWGKLHSVALVDYFPSGASAYDMLQAAEAVSPSFSVEKSALNVVIDPMDPVDKVISIQTYGPSGITWSVTESITWLSLQAASGSSGTPIVVQIKADALKSGSQQGTLHVTATGLGINTSQDITVTAYYGKLFYNLLPFIVFE